MSTFLLFNGSDQYCQAQTGITYGANFTFSQTFVTGSDINTEQWLYSAWGDNDERTLALRVRDGQLQTFIADNAGGSAVSASPFSLSVDSQYTVELQKTGATLTLTVNGALTSTVAVFSGVLNVSSLQPTLGCKNETTRTHFFSGKIGDTTLVTDSLTYDWSLENSNTGVGAVVVTEINNNNDFVGVNFPSDGSAWEVAGSDSITIGTPSNTFRQQSGGFATVDISGVYTGAPTSISYQVDSGAINVGEASPSGGAFSFPVTIPTGQHTITVFFGNDNSVSDFIENISALDVILCSGQSNLSGRLDNNQAISAGSTIPLMLGNDDVFKALEDPFDSISNQVDEISEETVTVGGSWFAKFIDLQQSGIDEPIAAIPCPKGGTTAAEWAKDSTDRINGLNLYESMIRRANITGVGINFYEQGEADARIGTDSTVYKNRLIQFAADVKNDLGVNTFIIPLHTIARADHDGNGVTTGQVPIRQAQIDAAAESENITIGQLLSDIDISEGAGTGTNDNVHFKTDEVALTVATRMYQSYYGLEPDTSTISGTISNIPAGTYSFKFFNDDTNTFIERKNVTFTDESFSETLSTAAGTNLFYIRPRIGGDDNTGAAEYGVTV